MSEAKMITLSKLKGMSGADIVALMNSGGFSLEVNGKHIGDVVRPLNALDEHLIAVSRFIADEVAAEMRRKAETLKVEDMFNPRTTQEILDTVAAKVVVQAPKQAEPAAEEPVKAAKPKSKAKPAAKPAPKPKRVKAEPETAPIAAVAIPEAVPTADADLHLDPFPEATGPADDTPIEELIGNDFPAQDAPIMDAVFEDIPAPLAEEGDLDAIPSLSGQDEDDDLDLDLPDAGVQDAEEPEVPAETLFEDLLLDEDDNLVEEAAVLPAETSADADEDDIFGDDTPLVRKMARRK